MKKVILSLGIIAAFTACKKEQEKVVIEDTTGTDAVVVDTETTETDKTVSLTINPASDSNLSGSADFVQSGDSVTLTVNISGVTPGDHAIHVHEFGDCSAPDGSSAGGHWNPTGHAHGEFGGEAFHMGDIGNLTADENGNATLTFTTGKWCLGCDDESQNLIGKSLIIHESVDDFTTQPTGNAGGRIGCVVIE